MNVVLISRDHRLGAILTMALSAPEQLTVLDSPAEVPESLEVEIDAVVLDLPADSRRDAYDELRQRYEGRVVVPVDNAKDTSGWPPDAKRRFLVRPFHVADLIAGVQEPQETSVAERAAKYRRRFRMTRSQAPAFPSLTAVPAADEPSPAPPAAATPEEPSLPAEPADTAAEEPAGADATETSADTGDDATVEFVMEEEAEDATAEGQDQAEAASEASAEDDAEAATEEDRAEAITEAGIEEEAEAAVEEDLAEVSTDEDAEAEAEEATAEDHIEAEDGDQDEDSGEDDEALIASLEGLVIDDGGEDEESGWADLEPGPRSVEDLRLLLSPEHTPTLPEQVPALPALPVRAGIVMAEAVALRQRLESEENRRSHGRRRRVLANVAAGLVLLLAGIGIGRAIAPDRPQRVSPPAVQQPVVQFRNAPPPTACTAAMDNADQVISYLVAKIRDERLSKSIQAYGANARACRTTGR